MATIGQTVYATNKFGNKLTIDNGYTILDINSSGMYIRIKNDKGKNLWYISTIFTNSIGGGIIVNPPEVNTEITYENFKLITQSDYDSLSQKDSDTVYAIINE